MKKLFVQFLKFLMISGTGWLIDFGTYIFLTSKLYLKVMYANMISAIPAITFVFLVSTKKIFKTQNSNFSLKQKYIIYFIYQMVLIIIISAFGQFLYDIAMNNEIIKYALLSKYLKLIIKVFITPITMIINFFVMKYLSEKL